MNRLLCVFALLVLSAFFALAQNVTVIPLPDVAGIGQTSQFSSTVVGGVAVWVQVVCNGIGTIRLGSSTTSPGAGVGVPCATGGSFFYPPILLSPGVFRKYDLSTLLYNAPSGSIVSISYAQ